MKQFYKLLFKQKWILLAILLCGVLTVGFGRPDSVILPRHVMLSWTDDPATTMTITWQTGRFSGGNQVEYKEMSDEATAGTQFGFLRQVATDKGMVTVHSVHLTALKPNTTYQYRVGGYFFWSSYYTFTTAPSKPADFKFLLFGDSQSVAYDLWQRTLHMAYERNPDAVFMMNVGDLVDIGLNYTQWNGWFGAGQGILGALPIMPVMGNHETYTTEWKIAPPLLYENFFELPDNGPNSLKGKVYSFDYGEAHFSVLDSQRQEEEENIPDILPLQQEWLAKDLASTNKRWKIIFMHRPVYHNRPSFGDEDLRAAFTPLFERYHVDVVLAAHDHGYARSFPISGGRWTDEKGTGPVYITTGRSGEKTFDRAHAKSWDAVFYNPMDQPNYLTVEVSSKGLKVKAFKLNGDLIDTWGKAN